MGLGMPEVVLILVIALIVFGPRKLPELGKSLGQAMSQFRRASEDFKRTWEQEVELEKVRKPETTGNSSYDDHASNGYNDPYNPYDNESDSSHQPALASESHDGSHPVSDNPETETAKTETVAAGIGANPATPASDSKKQHWI